MIYLRGDSNPIVSIKPEVGGSDGEWYLVLLADDPPNAKPLPVHISRLVADGGAAEIEATAGE